MKIYFNRLIPIKILDSILPVIESIGINAKPCALAIPM